MFQAWHRWPIQETRDQPGGTVDPLEAGLE
jgi:hypothetical protein